jgi:hypothetical protein
LTTSTGRQSAKKERPKVSGEPLREPDSRRNREMKKKKTAEPREDEKQKKNEEEEWTKRTETEKQNINGK